MSHQLHFEIVNKIDAPRLASMWQELEARSNPTFFLSWNWIGSWIAEAKLTPEVVIAHAEGQIVLLGLLVSKRRWTALGFPTRSLHLHNTGEQDKDVITIEYNGFLVDKNWVEKAVPEGIAFLLSLGRHNEIHLKNVTDDYVQLAPVPGALHSVLWRKPSWRVDLDSIRASGRQYLDHLSANTRQQIRRSMRLYESVGPLTATRAPDTASALSFLDGLKGLHQRYWSARGKPGAFNYVFFEQFHRRLIQSCYPQGGVELLCVRRGDEPIGYLYNLIYRGHVFAYQSGFLYEDNPKLKPGLVTHCLCIDRHLQEGASIYDFMAGDSRYKADLGKPGPFMSFLLLQHPTLSVLCERWAQAGYHAVRGMVRSN